MRIIRITVKELTETDTIVMNPAAKPVNEIREENLSITRQRYGISYRFNRVVNGELAGRMLGTLRYTDTVWVQR